MASYEFTGHFESHIRDMLNALSIRFYYSIRFNDNQVFCCDAVDDKGQLSTFNIEFTNSNCVNSDCVNQVIYFTRTNCEFQSYHSQLIKISNYLAGINIKFVIPRNNISTYVYTKEDNMNELSFINLDEYDTFDGAYKCQLAFTMMHYMSSLATQCPDKPFFTNECPYFTHITEWAYNRDDLEVNQYLHINYVTQIVKSLNFIYVVAHIPYINPAWITNIMPYVMIHMKSENQHIQRNALMVAVYLYREKKITIFNAVSVTLVSDDDNAKMYLNELK
jgi:hypothetical protein